MARTFAVQHAGPLLQSFQLADRDIAALVNTARCHDLHQRLDNGVPAQIHGQCQQLHDQNLAEPVNDQARQEICLPVHEAVSVRFRQETFPVLQAACEPFNEKGRIHCRERRLREDAHPDLRCRIVIPRRQITALMIKHIY
ncbi:hypothetical protein D3C73_1291900 [compost metagenome]